MLYSVPVLRVIVRNIIRRYLIKEVVFADDREKIINVTKRVITVDLLINNKNERVFVIKIKYIY